MQVMRGIIPFLILFPLVIAVLMYIIRNDKVRGFLAIFGAIVLMVAAAVLTASWLGTGGHKVRLYNGEGAELASNVILAAEVALMVYVTYMCFRYRKYWISLLSIVPTCMMIWTEKFGPSLASSYQMYVDHLAILMCIIVAVIGGLIVIYAVGYLEGYHHHHKEVEDRRNYFLMVMFMFLAAMYGFVLSDSLLWIDLFWEVTSVCSFMLIGYTKMPDAIHNSFRALWMNLLGGFALAIGILYFAVHAHTVSLQILVSSGTVGQQFALIPVALIAFAALTKTAQLPFSTWLLGAMVAPTPSSALLHSATMVKAGVYVLLRLAPAMSGTITGYMISFIGGFTFLMASIMAIAQTDAKKVLAFSTISNLGLMVACAGIGRPETVWAGVFLMIFHAVSKSLLFQDVGATENSLYSRDIEDMHGLMYRLPKLAMFMFIGIAGMFLAPFGMLISKWSALRASVDEKNIIMVFFICFGSATTSFYWTKWMGKLIMRTNAPAVKDVTKPGETVSLTVHAILMIALCLLFPVLSNVYVDKLVIEIMGSTHAVLPTGLLYTLIVVVCLVFLVPLAAFKLGSGVSTNMKLSYMNGVNVGNNHEFVDSFGKPRGLYMTNYYFAHKIGQRKLMMPSRVIATAVIVIMLCVIIVGGAV